jgi:hypothetical protein
MLMKKRCDSTFFIWYACARYGALRASDWSLVGDVWLNPEKDDVKEPEKQAL